MATDYNRKYTEVDNLDELLDLVFSKARYLSNLPKYHIIAGAWVNPTNHSIRTNKSFQTGEELKRSFDSRLIEALAPLGKLGEKTDIKVIPEGEKRNYIGNCAEQRACNDVLIRDLSKRLPIEQIKYTDAIRIRDFKKKDYCFNCRTALHLTN